MIPHTPNPAEHGDQITNDIICNAGIWRNGGSDGDTHLCDDCLRVGLRVLKLKIDEALEVVEAGTDRLDEVAELTERLALLQHHHQWLAYEHNRMQVRLGKMLDVIDAAGIAEMGGAFALGRIAASFGGSGASGSARGGANSRPSGFSQSPTQSTGASLTIVYGDSNNRDSPRFRAMETRRAVQMAGQIAPPQGVRNG